MQVQTERDRADVPPGQDSPLSYALYRRDSEIVRMVSAAVRHKNVRLAYQSIVAPKSDYAPIIVEGLIRVLDPAGRVIPAGDFIDAIEDTETGRMIDCIALERGLQVLMQCPDLRMSINMSARSLGYSRWKATLNKYLRADPTLAKRLILEMSEQSAMLVPELVISFMREKQKQGVGFALDDFGRGMTSFRHLKSFAFDILKIDGQYTRGIAQDTDNQVLCSAILAMAKQFDMLVIAENVETVQDANYLGQLGVDFLQGYFYDAPTVKPNWLPQPKHSN